MCVHLCSECSVAGLIDFVRLQCEGQRTGCGAGDVQSQARHASGPGNGRDAHPTEPHEGGSDGVPRGNWGEVDGGEREETGERVGGIHIYVVGLKVYDGEK